MRKLFPLIITLALMTAGPVATATAKPHHDEHPNHDKGCKGSCEHEGPGPGGHVEASEPLSLLLGGLGLAGVWALRRRS